MCCSTRQSVTDMRRAFRQTDRQTGSDGLSRPTRHARPFRSVEIAAGISRSVEREVISERGCMAAYNTPGHTVRTSALCIIACYCSFRNRRTSGVIFCVILRVVRGSDGKRGDGK